MKTFTRNLIVALFFAGAYAADVVVSLLNSTNFSLITANDWAV
jgi:hypothetical protein